MNELNYDQIIAIEYLVEEFKKELRRQPVKYKERSALGIVDKQLDNQLGKAQRKFDKYADKMFKDYQKGAS